MSGEGTHGGCPSLMRPLRIPVWGMRRMSLRTAKGLRSNDSFRDPDGSGDDPSYLPHHPPFPPSFQWTFDPQESNMSPGPSTTTNTTFFRRPPVTWTNKPLSPVFRSPKVRKQREDEEFGYRKFRNKTHSKSRVRNFPSCSLLNSFRILSWRTEVPNVRVSRL